MDRDNDVELIEKETAYQGYFRIDRYTLRHRKYDGGWTRPIERELFERGHAVAVLPYDPVTDTVLLIEQFRVAPYAAGDHPWVLEVIAGIVEEGESQEDVARRESLEEAGLAVEDLAPIIDYYVSPGGTTESIKIYLALADLSHAGGVHGLDQEDEDIKVLTISFGDAMNALNNGRIVASPAVIALQWLALNRNRIREQRLGRSEPE